MDKLFSAHFIQEPYVFVQTLANYKAHELTRITYPLIMVTAGFILGYLVRHIQHSIKKTYRYKRKTYH